MTYLAGIVMAPKRRAAATTAMVAAEALRRAAAQSGTTLILEVRHGLGRYETLSAAQIAGARGVFVVGDDAERAAGERDASGGGLGEIDADVFSEARLAGRTAHRATLEEAIRAPDAVLSAAAGLGAGEVTNVSAAGVPAAGVPAAGVPATTTSADAPLHIVAITSCPTGIAHTFMAAEGLVQGAKALGHQIHVETQGSVGAQNRLSDVQIARADLVVIAADTQVDKARFAGKRLYETGTKGAIGKGADLLRKAIVEARIDVSLAGAGATRRDAAGVAAPNDGRSEGVRGNDAATSAPRSRASADAYRHLMTGVSFMLPFIVAGGLLIALSFALGGIYAFDDAHKGTLAWSLFQIGAKSAFVLIVPVLSGYIAYSIADRPGIAPGMVGGMLASSLNAGFLGGIVSGFMAGYIALLISRKLPLPRNLQGLKPVLIIPLLSTLAVGLLMIYVVGTPVATALHALESWLRAMQTGSAVALGALLGAMMAFDMGGPVNKAAYAFSTGLLASSVYTPMAAVMAAGMTPPLGIAVACWLFRSRFTLEEREAGNAAGVLGLAFISEGAIPFVARDPLRIIPACMIGSAIAGAISMGAGVELKVPHGGIFVLPIPNAVTHVGMYVVAIVAGTLATALAVGLVKRRQPIVAVDAATTATATPVA
ncbi:MAG: fructose-specific PTS transporter subunit EIIC [Janthinobacterium lividum]